jgi:hypothetical protein
MEHIELRADRRIPDRFWKSWTSSPSLRLFAALISRAEAAYFCNTRFKSLVGEFGFLVTNVMDWPRVAAQTFLPIVQP